MLNICNTCNGLYWQQIIQFLSMDAQACLEIHYLAWATMLSLGTTWDYKNMSKVIGCMVDNNFVFIKSHTSIIYLANRQQCLVSILKLILRSIYYAKSDLRPILASCPPTYKIDSHWRITPQCTSQIRLQMHCEMRVYPNKLQIYL